MNEEEKEKYLTQLDDIPLDVTVDYIKNVMPEVLPECLSEDTIRDLYSELAVNGKDHIALVEEIYQLKRNNMDYTQSLDELIYLIIGRI